MQEPKELLHKFWDLMGQHFRARPVFDDWLALWCDDGVYEQAYPAGGKPVRCVGKAEISGLIGPMDAAFRDFEFTEPTIFATDDPALYMVRTTSEAVVASTGRTYLQDYLWLFWFRDGRIAYWRAYLNPLEVQKAFAPR